MIMIKLLTQSSTYIHGDEYTTQSDYEKLLQEIL